jgi:hypothetical protein
MRRQNKLLTALGELVAPAELSRTISKGLHRVRVPTPRPTMGRSLIEGSGFF